MEHVVFFTESPGEPEFRCAGDLEEAVRLVERLRNERGIADISVHALTPVPVSFRTYYRVEVSAQPAEAAQPAAAEVPAPPPTLVIDEVVEAEAEPEVAEAVVAEMPDVEQPDVEVPQVEEPVFEVAALEVVAFGRDRADEYELPSLEVPSLVDDAPLVAAVSELVVEPADEFEAFVSYEPLVPQVRPEPEAERSLGYFAN